MDKKQIPVAHLDGSCTWVDSADAAALMGLAKLPYDANEHSLVIYQREDGKYCYSKPVTSDRRDSFALRSDPTAGRLAAIGHSHPGNGQYENSFSEADVNVADQLKRDSYIRTNNTGEVRKYIPGVSRTESDPVPGKPSLRRKTSAGEPVGSLSRREQLAQAYDLHTPPTAP